MLQNIRIVLVETSHTGNMGSVARAMKTMGLTNLWLVNPLVKPDSQAIALAAGASDVIGNANIAPPGNGGHYYSLFFCCCSIDASMPRRMFSSWLSGRARVNKRRSLFIT